MRCGLFAALFAALLIVLSGGSSVSAASIYDNDLRVTDELIVQWDDTTDPIDITYDYDFILASNISDPLALEVGAGIQSGEGYWTIGQIDRVNTNPYQSDRRVQLIYIPDGYPEPLTHTFQGNSYPDDTNAYFRWSSTSNNRTLTFIGNHIDYAIACEFSQNSDGELDYTCRDSSTNITFIFGVSSTWNTYLFASNIDIYPEDYEGTVNVPEYLGQNETISPDFTYSVIDKEVTAKDHKKDLPEFEPDEGYNFEGYEVEWSLFKDTELIDHQIILQEKDYEFTVDDYGSYRLEARYLVQQCYRYEGYPETPDYCFYVDLGTEFEDLDFTSTAVNLEIDGSSIAGNTALMDCDAAGVCRLPDKTPAALFFSGLDNMNTYGLTQFFTAPINFLATLPAKADNCTPITFPLMGETISIECLKPRYYEWSTAIMNIYTTVLIAGTGYLIAFNVFRNIKDINTPDKDKIEVARL